jgi:hypothetical protein
VGFFQKELVRWVAAVGQKGHSRELGNDFAQQFEPFSGEALNDRPQPGKARKMSQPGMFTELHFCT